LDRRRADKLQLSVTAKQLAEVHEMTDVSERMNQIEVEWIELESALDRCHQQMTVMQAAKELTTWIDGVEQAVRTESTLQPKSCDDVEQLHSRFQVRHNTSTKFVSVGFGSRKLCESFYI